MEGTHAEYIALALFIASELVGMSKLRSNSLLQLLLAAGRRAYPYKAAAPKPLSPLDVVSQFTGDKKGRR